MRPLQIARFKVCSCLTRQPSLQLIVITQVFIITSAAAGSICLGNYGVACIFDILQLLLVLIFLCVCIVVQPLQCLVHGRFDLSMEVGLVSRGEEGLY